MKRALIMLKLVKIVVVFIMVLLQSECVDEVGRYSLNSKSHSVFLIERQHSVFS